MTKKVPPGGQKMNYTKNQPPEVDQRAMPIRKMVSLLILPFRNQKSAKGRHPSLRILFPFLRNLHLTFLTAVHTVKSRVEILHNFEAFSEYMNLTKDIIITQLTVYAVAFHSVVENSVNHHDQDDDRWSVIFNS